jgi:hypothetical protein
MFLCRLCGLQIEIIPHDAVLIGKLHRFEDGCFTYSAGRGKARIIVPPRNLNREAPRELPPTLNK